jgi:peptidyl-prolyl cis-trans isomerase D
MFRWKNKQLDGLDKQKLLKNTGTYAVLLTTLFAMAFFGVCDPSQSGGPTGPRGAAATVDGSEVTYNQFLRAYRSKIENYKQQYGENFNPAMVRVAQETMNDLINKEIIYKTALANGVGTSDDEVITMLQNANEFRDEKGNFKEENFKGWLQGNGFTEASFMLDMKRNMTVQKFSQLMSKVSFVSKKEAQFTYLIKETKADVEFLKVSATNAPLEVTQDEINAYVAAEANKGKLEAYFAQNSHEYNVEEQVKARHILIQFTGARNALGDAAKRTKEQAKKLAEEVLVNAKKASDFGALAKESTDEASGKSSGGDLGFFTRDKMVKEFSDAAFALSAGAVSEIVESPFGFHIIKVEEKKAPISKTLDMVKNDIARELIKKDKAPLALKALADEAFKAAKESPNTLPAHLKWESTGEFSIGAGSIPKLGGDEALRGSILSFKTPGDMSVAPILSQESWYILKLKSQKMANVASATDKMLEEISTSGAYSQGNRFFTSFRQQLRKDYDKRNAIKPNQDYLALDKADANGG